MIILDRLLRGEPVSYDGRYYRTVTAEMPTPVQQPRPPFVIAANGPRAVRIAVRLAARPGDGWATTGVTAAEDGQEAWWAGIREVVARVDEACAATGRDPGSLDRYLNLDSDAAYSLSSLESFRDGVGRARELGFTDVIAHWPRASKHYVGDEAVLDAVAGDLPALRG